MPNINLGSVFVDIPPMPNTLLGAATAFPTAAPSAIGGTYLAQAITDMEGMISLTHNATNGSPPSFMLVYWSDVTKFWIAPLAAQACASGALITWKLPASTKIFIYASVALTGASSGVYVGGVTIAGNLPVLQAGA